LEVHSLRTNMNKQKNSRATYDERLALNSSSGDDDNVFEKPSKARKSNIYDAVAGTLNVTNDHP
jgi:hypothetical protein